MILACSSLSSLACGQLLIISAWHQLFSACGKVWRLEPHKPVRGLHISARGSVNLFSTQTFPQEAKHASWSPNNEGLFAGISVRSNSGAWLAPRAASHLTRTSCRLAFAFVRQKNAKKLCLVCRHILYWMIFAIVCYQSLQGKALKFKINKKIIAFFNISQYLWLDYCWNSS